MAWGRRDTDRQKSHSSAVALKLRLHDGAELGGGQTSRLGPPAPHPVPHGGGYEPGRRQERGCRSCPFPDQGCPRPGVTRGWWRPTGLKSWGQRCPQAGRGMPSPVGLGGGRIGTMGGGQRGEAGESRCPCAHVCPYLHEHILHLWYSRVTAWMWHFQHLSSIVPACSTWTHVTASVRWAPPPAHNAAEGAAGSAPAAPGPVGHCLVPRRSPQREVPQHPTGAAVLPGIWGWATGAHLRTSALLFLASSGITKLQAGFLLFSTSVGRKEKGRFHCSPLPRLDRPTLAGTDAPQGLGEKGWVDASKATHF